MKWNHTGKEIVNERGMVLVVALLMIAVLVLLGSTAIMTTNTDMKIATNYKGAAQALYIAEAGLNRAIVYLPSQTVDINTMLKGADGTGGTADDGRLSFGSSVSFGEGSYEVKVVDNNDDGDLFTDLDKKVKVISTGKGPGGSVRRIEAIVEKSTNVAGIFNFKFLDTCESKDWNVPQYFDCSGDACRITNYVVNNCNDPTSPSVEPTTQQWLDFIAEISKRAVTGFGTRENPTIQVAGSGQKITLSGSNDGAGIIVVKDGGILEFSGNAHFEGLIILVGNATLTVGSNSNIFGAIAKVNFTGKITLPPPGSQGGLHFSSQALNTMGKLDDFSEFSSGGGGSIVTKLRSWRDTSIH